MRAADGQSSNQPQQNQDRVHVQPQDADQTAAAQLRTLQTIAQQVQKSADGVQGAVERAEALCKQAAKG